MWDRSQEQFVDVPPEDTKRQEGLGNVIFTVGQEIEVNGLRCRVRKITKKDLILRPISERPKEAKDDDMITVCSECGRACCWQGYFMCDEARGANIASKKRGELKKTKLEAPDWWVTDDDLADGKGRRG